LVSEIRIYAQEAVVPKGQAAQFMADWQNWISDASESISSVVFAKKHRATGRIFLEVKGLVLGTEPKIAKRLALALYGLGPTARRMMKNKSFKQAFEWFSAGEDLPPTYEKGKSDIVKKTFMRSEWRFLFDELPPDIDVEIHGLGGRMAEISSNQTAFPHRSDASLLIQWGTAWERAEQEQPRLQEINALYEKL